MTDNFTNDPAHPNAAQPPVPPHTPDQQHYQDPTRQTPQSPENPAGYPDGSATGNEQDAYATPHQPTPLYTQEPFAVPVDPAPEQQRDPFAPLDPSALGQHPNMPANQAQAYHQHGQDPHAAPGQGAQHHGQNPHAVPGQGAQHHDQNPHITPHNATQHYNQNPSVTPDQAVQPHGQNPHSTPHNATQHYGQNSSETPVQAAQHHGQKPHISPHDATQHHDQNPSATPGQATQHQVQHPYAATQQAAHQPHRIPNIPPVQPAPQASSYNQTPDPQAQPEPVPYPVKQKTRTRGGKGVTFIVGLLGVIVGAALSVGALYIATSGFSFSGTVDTSGIVIEPAKENTELAEAVAAKVTPSVVNIDVYASQATNPLEDFFGSESGEDSSVEQTGLGSGVILTNDGYIITNFHVIDGAEQLLVSIGDEQYPATVVGEEPQSDLAVIKVEATDLVPIELGDSDEVNVGEWVMAVGSPFGLEKSVSTGIVSALYRSTVMQSQSGTTIYANLIQTDAAINPGNSGGALVNSEGQLIGINTLINSTSGSSSGVGFAMPVNYAFDIADKLIKGETIEHPYIGVTLFSVDAAVADELGLSVESGAYIESVLPDSPAAEAGLQEGDVITMAGGKHINTSAELIIEIRGHEIGSTVTFRINRGGEDIDLNVVLGSTAS